MNRFQTLLFNGFNVLCPYLQGNVVLLLKSLNVDNLLDFDFMARGANTALLPFQMEMLVFWNLGDSKIFQNSKSFFWFFHPDGSFLDFLVPIPRIRLRRTTS